MPPANPPTGEETPETPKASEVPPTGAVNPQDNAVNEEVEAARKLPNTENAIAGMIKARVKASGKK